MPGPCRRETTSLSRDAKAVLQESQPFVDDEENQRTDNEEDQGVEDFETEEEVIAKALAEAALERKEEKNQKVQSTHDPDNDRVESSQTQSSNLEDDLFSFPSLATHEPIPEEEDRIDDDLKKRMDLLLGLSGPLAAPTNKQHSGEPSLPDPPKREVGQGWNLPGYNDSRDNDLESWCCE